MTDSAPNHDSLLPGSENTGALAQPTQPVAVVYRFLAQCLHYPDPSWMTQDFFTELIALIRHLGGAEEAAALEQACLPDVPLEALQIAYTRLFINGAPHVIAPPYGSIYLDGSLQGPSTERTRAFYRDNGYDMAAGADLPDHLVHELEFLSHLAQRDDRRGEQDFLGRIFRTWFPSFRDRVYEDHPHVYYRTVVDLIDYFTKEDE